MAMTFDSSDEDDEVINSKASTTREQVNRQSGCTITKSAAEIKAQYEVLPNHLSSQPTMPVTNHMKQVSINIHIICTHFLAT